MPGVAFHRPGRVFPRSHLGQRYERGQQRRLPAVLLVVAAPVSGAGMFCAAATYSVAGARAADYSVAGARAATYSVAGARAAQGFPNG